MGPVPSPLAGTSTNKRTKTTKCEVPPHQQKHQQQKQEQEQEHNTCRWRVLLDVNILNAPMWMGIFVSMICLACLDSTDCSSAFVSAAFTLAVMTLWSYFIHRFTHEFKPPVLWHLHGPHHDPARAHTLRAKIGEILFNVLFVSGAGVTLLLTLVFGHILHTKTVLFYAILYTTIHMINYHDPAHTRCHAQHHVDPTTNIAPTMYDILFNSYHSASGASSPLEDLTHILPNIAFALVTTCALTRVLAYLHGR